MDMACHGFIVPMPKVATTSYNISFPTTLQPRDRFDLWRGHGGHLPPLQIVGSSAKYSSGTGSSCSSQHSPGSSVTVRHIKLDTCQLIYHYFTAKVSTMFKIFGLFSAKLPKFRLCFLQNSDFGYLWPRFAVFIVRKMLKMYKLLLVR